MFNLVVRVALMLRPVMIKGGGDKLTGLEPRNATKEDEKVSKLTELNDKP